MVALAQKIAPYTSKNDKSSGERKRKKEIGLNVPD